VQRSETKGSLAAMEIPGATKSAAASGPKGKVPPSGGPSMRHGQPSDALSLHSNYNVGSLPGEDEMYYDDDPPELNNDDLPPLYTDSVEDTPISVANPLLPSDIPVSTWAGAPKLHLKDSANGNEFYIDRRLDTDPSYLEKHVDYLSHFPPRPYVQLRGTHRETKKKGEKTETETFVDFDVKVDLTPFLYSDINRQASWRELHTVDNLAKVRRGTVLKTRAPGFGGKSTGAVQLETGNGPPSLQEWCHRYCASHAGLKSFLVQRRVVGFDEDYIEEKLENLVRATHYRGHLKVTFPVNDSQAEVYNEARINHWRLVRWIQILCFVTLMFIFIIPYIWIRTKRFEVVYVDWYFSRRRASDNRKEYVSISEDQWYNMWARAIQKSVLAKRQGMLDQSDLLASETEAPNFQACLGNIDNSTVRGLVQAGVNAMNVVNRQFGWGGDT
jgi:hypothetical protein